MNQHTPSKIIRYSQYLAYLKEYELLCIQVAHGHKIKKAERAIYGALLAEYEIACA